MNYAEDRLDRRAASSRSSSEAGATTPAKSTQDILACDLRRAHDVFSRRDEAIDADARPPAADDDATTAIRSLRDLGAAHELAGKTLRDEGRNRQSVFHFGMAWKCRHRLERESGDDRDRGDTGSAAEADDESRSAGDYAQICELSGFPEIGALALLFHRAGGNLESDSDSDQDSDSTTPLPSGAASEDESDRDEGTRGGCGCGAAGCGASPCFVAFPPSSPIAKGILRALDELPVGPRDASFPTASEVLARLADATRKSDAAGDAVAAVDAFLSERQVTSTIPPILRYWDEEDVDSAREETTNDGADRRCTTDDRRTQPDRFERRALPPPVLLLLLKLLYSSPPSGPFLALACASAPCLAARFPPATREGRALARRYKSHWAYYVLIRHLVLGERMKKHRRGRVVHHVPVWDVLFGTDAPAGVGPKGGEEEKKEDCGLARGEREKVSGYLERTLQACSSQCTQSVFKCDESNVLQCQSQKSSCLPFIRQQQISSCTAHPIFVVGDSHVLSLAWHTLCIDPSKRSEKKNPRDASPIYRTAIPFPATGMKAWHVRPSTRFFTHYNLHACIQRLPPSSRRSIILSAGEIDCREGIGGALLQGYSHDCGDAVERTAAEYLAALTSIAEQYRLQVLVMPVAPHAHRSEKNGKSTGRARRRETMDLWNEILRRELPNDKCRSKYDRVFLLDYERKLRQSHDNSPVGYVLNPSYNADYTHVNSAILPLVEDAILQCGCDLTLL